MFVSTVCHSFIEASRRMFCRKRSAVSMIVPLSCFILLTFSESKTAQDEVDALRQIATTLGAKDWKFDPDPCESSVVGVVTQQPNWSDNSVDCDCTIGNDSLCHIQKIAIKGFSLRGVLPPELVKLPYIQEVDFAYNVLTGTIPVEWGSIPLKSISVLVNRLSGEIPQILGNITTLTYLNLEGNQFSGTVPFVLGKLINLQTLILSSNLLVGKLPKTFSRLTNLTDFRINDNNMSGPIPDVIQNWKQLTKLELHATGFEGPIPANISVLNKLIDLRISDINGPSQEFPQLEAMAGLTILVLRNCNISGDVPSYIWKWKRLQTLDLSFNMLVGEIPNTISARSMLKFVFLTRNMFSGYVPESILMDGINLDLSYNNLTWQGPDQPACRPNMNLYVNLYKSSLTGNSIQRFLPCTDGFSCPRYGCSFRVNCGGNRVTANEGNREVDYEGDAGVEGGSAKYFSSSSGNWGFSSTGDFMDDSNDQNTRFIETVRSTGLSELYSNARVSPLSLTYFRYCLENGGYDVRLHFAEIIFTNKTYYSLGRRVFDIYIQDSLVWKDFNIEDEAKEALKPIVKHFNVNVTNNFLEIRLYWAGKGTTRIPLRGHYGSLISAISVDPHFRTCEDEEGDKKKKGTVAFIIVGSLVGCIVLIISGFLWWWCKGSSSFYSKRKNKDVEGVELQTISYTLKQMKAATNNFDDANKLGEGGFGPVYKGQLGDGTLIAVKQLSSKSRQGNREFLNEIGMISCLQHPNLVKLYGCCIEGDQLLVVYEYMDNNSLANALFSNNGSGMILDWATRFNICLGIARGLAFLHEESTLKIVHRDIKATNVLLDRNLSPKISDFGLARLNEGEKTHISTRIAGTVGYMAPEYALWGYLSYKADVYSFGVVLLEIVSGKSNNNYLPSNNCICLLDWACHLQLGGNLEELIDPKLCGRFNKSEAEVVVRVALACTSATASLRPMMSEVVGMLEGHIAVPYEVPEAGVDDLRFKAMKDLRRERLEHSSKSGFGSSSSTSASGQYHPSPI
ncbi:unnamed protein product [Cuscuta campestris]|uniref:non-specific serine/threonine protein kinase n=1 Tax=Cuscuta campestris TaxID=132261 RepID=A0A484N1H1_9ASTE|nr:unnamed protein product [Cuscuta campestris]